MAGINRTTGKATDLITFSRASGGTALRKISYGPELVTNGDFSGGSTGWSASASWTIGSGVATSSGGTGQIIQVGKLTIGKVYLITYDATISGGYATIFGTSLQIKAGSGLTASFKCSNTSLGFYGFGFTGSIDNISVKEVLFDQPDGTLTLFNHPTNIPRIEYDADGTVKGLLIEEQRTNLVSRSNDFSFSAPWSTDPTGATVVKDQIGPDAIGNSATTFSDVGTNAANRAATVSVANDSAIYSASIYIKKTTAAATFPGFGVILTGGTTVFGQVTVNTDNGTLTDRTGYSPLTKNVEDCGDYWRVSVSQANNSSGNTSIIFAINAAVNSDASGTWFTATTGSCVIYGAQLEAGSFPTSYIPTSGATATRAADIASISVDNFGYNQKAGTVVVEATPPTGVELSASVRAYTLVGLNSQIGATFIYDNAVFDIANSNASAGTHGTAFKSGSMAIVNNGATPRVSSATLDGDYSSAEILLGAFSSGTNMLNGHIKSIAYYPRRLSNAQLQALTA